MADTGRQRGRRTVGQRPTVERRSPTGPGTEVGRPAHRRGPSHLRTSARQGGAGSWEILGHRAALIVGRALSYRRPARYLLALAVYSAVALWLTGLAGHDIVHQMINQNTDPDLTLFFLRWWPWAILHGQNPFHVRQLTWPGNYNAAWLTSVAGPALLGAPVTLLFGSLATWNLWILVAPVTASMGMLVLLDALEVRGMAAITGGFIFGFCSYLVAQLQGHLFLVVVFPLPLLGALIVWRLKRRLRRRWFVGLTVVLVTFLLYTSTELFATMILVAFFAAVLFFLWYRRAFLRQLRQLAAELARVAGCVAVLGAPLLAYVLADLGIGNSSIQTVLPTDLLNFVVPTETTLFGRQIMGSVAAHFANDIAENGSYLGIILVVLCTVAMAEAVRRGRWAAPLAIWTVLLAVFTLGPSFQLNGKVTSLSLPWKLAVQLPVLKDALPSRLMVYVALMVAVWVAMWASWATSGRSRLLRSAAIMAGAALLTPNPGVFVWRRPDVPRAVVDGRLAASIPAGKGLLVVPEPAGVSPAVWAEASGFKLAVTGAPWGYDPYTEAQGYTRWPLSYLLNLATPPSNTVVQLEAFCATHDDGAVAVPDGAPRWSKLLTTAGWLARRLSGVTVFRVPSAALARYRHVSPSRWEVAFYQNEVRSLLAAATCYLRHGGTLASLNPDAAVADHCLQPGYSSRAPSSNWTAEGAWLGPQHGEIGVGLAVNGELARQVLSALPRPIEFLFYGKGFRISRRAMVTGPVGTYLAVEPLRAT